METRSTFPKTPWLSSSVPHRARMRLTFKDKVTTADGRGVGCHCENGELNEYLFSKKFSWWGATIDLGF